MDKATVGGGGGEVEATLLPVRIEPRLQTASGSQAGPSPGALPTLHV